MVAVYNEFLSKSMSGISVVTSFSRQMDNENGKAPAGSGISSQYNRSSGALAQKHEAGALLSVAAQRPVLIIADTDHRTGDAERVLNNPDFIRGLTAQGKKDIYIERSNQATPLVEQFYNGEISKDEFASKMKSGFTGSWQSKDESDKTYDILADGIGLAKENGIKVHFVDRMPAVLSENPEGRDVYFKAREMYGSGASKKDVLGYLHGNFPGGKEGFDEFNEKLMQQRNDVNQFVADDVQKTMSDKGAVVIYGAMHFDGKNDIDDMIGKDRCASVSLYRDDKSKAEDLKSGPKKDDTDYTYTKETGHLSLTEQGQERGMEPPSSEFSGPRETPPPPERGKASPVGPGFGDR